MTVKEIKPNIKIGRWTVLDDTKLDDNGGKRWLCRCECGTERYVLERSLKYGSTTSCGCFRKDKARETNSYDLIGGVFGRLTVIGRSERETENRGIWWKCQCSCGNTCDVLGTLLVTGRKTHCGCKKERISTMSNIKGRKFGRLTALYPTEERTKKGNVMWHCSCTCGNEVDISYNELMYCDVRSCGCQKREHDMELFGFLTHIDGTSLDMLASNKTPTNNTTGYKGVYLIRGKYVAKIVFRKKAFYLGTYKNIDDAVAARKEAEEAVFETALPFYEAWLKRSEADPEWAAQNPISVEVKRDSQNRLYLDMAPKL